jgi:hypothetical protein
VSSITMHAREKIFIGEFMSGDGSKLSSPKLEDKLRCFEEIASPSVKNDVEKLKEQNKLNILEMQLNCHYDYIQDSLFPG